MSETGAAEEKVKHHPFEDIAYWSGIGTSPNLRIKISKSFNNTSLFEKVVKSDKPSIRSQLFFARNQMMSATRWGKSKFKALFTLWVNDDFLLFHP